MTITPNAPATAAETESQTLGVVYLPRTGSGVGQFEFLVDESATQVQIGTPVTAETVEGPFVGVVVDMRTVGSMADPVAAEYATNAPVAAIAHHSSTVKVATVQVFHAPALRSPSPGPVRNATAEEMLLATGYDRIDVAIPAGVVELGDGQYAKVCLDAHATLGPEAAHLVVAGLSGQAAKTSYAGVLMRSAMHACEQADESIAAVIFNVKGSDLVNLHLPPAAGYELSDEDEAMYTALGVPSTPFGDVTVYAPSLPGGEGTRSAREDALPLRWDLKQVWRYLRYFSPGLYSNDNMAALLGDIESQLMNPRDPNSLTTFNSMMAWMDSQIAQAEQNGASTTWRNHHIATLMRARKLIGSLPGRCGGLLSLERCGRQFDVPVESLRDQQVLVVDIAGLEPLVQSAVIASTCERLLHTAEGEDGVGVDHVIVFADELNMFAPASGGEMDSVRRILTKISATGRYAGISLWGAAQFLSQVSPQVVGNAATRAAGILADSEADSGVFGRIPAGQRERLVTLPKGQMALKAYNLRGMLTVKFPRPAWQTGKAKSTGAKRRRDTDVLALRPESLEALTEGVEREVVAEVIARHDGDPSKITAELERTREPDMARVSVETSNTYNPDNPWAIE